MKAFTFTTRELACAAAVLLVAVAASPAAAQGRGGSGLPPGSGNPLAALQSQIAALQSQIDALPQPATAPATALMWINHLDLVPGDTDVTATFNSTTSGVGGGLSGLIIQSFTDGDTSVSGGNKVVEKGLQVPPGWLIRGVRVCYELTNPRSFITQIRLAQVQPTPSTALVLLDDGTNQTDPGPICVNSMSLPAGFEIDPSAGGVRLSLRIFVDAAGVITAGDKIVIRALGLHLSKP
jgi:hypothetical protein